MPPPIKLKPNFARRYKAHGGVDSFDKILRTFQEDNPGREFLRLDFFCLGGKLSKAPRPEMHITPQGRLQAADKSRIQPLRQFLSVTATNTPYASMYKMPNPNDEPCPLVLPQRAFKENYTDYPTTPTHLQEHSCLVSLTNDAYKNNAGFYDLDMLVVHDVLLMPEVTWEQGINMSAYFSLIPYTVTPATCYYTLHICPSAPGTPYKKLYAQDAPLTYYDHHFIQQRLLCCTELKFPAGTEVIIKKLQSNQHYNGLTGIVHAFRKDKQRYVVCLPSKDNTEILVKEINFHFKTAPPSNAPALTTTDHYQSFYAPNALGDLSYIRYQSSLLHGYTQIMRAHDRRKGRSSKFYDEATLKAVYNMTLSIRQLGKWNNTAWVVEITVKKITNSTPRNYFPMPFPLWVPGPELDDKKIITILSNELLTTLTAKRQALEETFSKPYECGICFTELAEYILIPCLCYGVCTNCGDKAFPVKPESAPKKAPLPLCPWCRTEIQHKYNPKDVIRMGLNIQLRSKPREAEAEAEAGAGAAQQPTYSCDNPACTNKADKKCNGCLSVSYCSLECQKVHWKAGHKAACQAKTASKKPGQKI
jgi:hypothetical protein